MAVVIARASVLYWEKRRWERVFRIHGILRRRYPLHRSCTGHLPPDAAAHRPGNSLRPVYTSQALAALWETEDKGTALRLEYRIKQLTRTEKERLIHEDTAFSQLLPQLEVSRYRRRPGITLEMCLEGKIDA